jgi:hypothetical protein
MSGSVFEDTAVRLARQFPQWQPIETAPKDGTRFLACGKAYAELRDDGFRWIVHETDNALVPFVCIIKWQEHWYDEEIDNGDGTYRKEPKLSMAFWSPHHHAFRPTHWMSLPEPISD